MIYLHFMLRTNNNGKNAGNGLFAFAFRFPAFAYARRTYFSPLCESVYYLLFKYSGNTFSVLICLCV